MSIEVLEQIIRQFLQYGNTDHSVRFLWHGGEPLLAGLSFFQNIVFLQEKYNIHGYTIQNSLQTNGTLINDKWAK